MGASLHDLVSDCRGPGLSGVGALVGMSILPSQQLVSHWSVGREGRALMKENI